MARGVPFILRMIALVSTAASAEAVQLTIHRETGAVLLFNDAAAPADVAGYAILSDAGALKPDRWRSITQNYDSDSGGTVDPNDAWFLLASDNNELSEATLGAARLAPRQFVDLGTGTFMRGGSENVRFEYVDAATELVLPGTVRFVSGTLAADFDSNAAVDANDYRIWQAHFGIPFFGSRPIGDADDDGDIDGGDYLVWQREFGSDLLSAAGGGAQADAVVAAVPEPSACALCILLLSVLGRSITGKPRALPEDRAAKAP